MRNERYKMWRISLIVACLSIILFDLMGLTQTIRKFPQLDIDKEHLFGQNGENLKDFNLCESGILYSESDDPWSYYTLQEPMNIKSVKIIVDSVSKQNIWAQLHFILEDGSWVQPSFYIRDGSNVITTNKNVGLENVVAIRFDFVSEKDCFVNIDMVSINNRYVLVEKTITLNLTIVLLMSMILFFPKYKHRIFKESNMYQQNWENAYSFFLIISASISLIPLIVVSKYNHPSADDFSYCVNTYHEWSQSHSLWNLFWTALSTSKRFYNEWQGLYSSAFFLSLSPHIFGEKYYALVGIMMLTVIIFSTCFFFWFIIKKIIGGTTLDGLVVGSVVSFLMIQRMPSCVEGLYWYNGAVNYGLFYAIMLLLVCASIGIHIAYEKKYVIKRTIFCCALGFLLEGGNHVTAFTGILFICILLFMEILMKNKMKAIIYSGILLFMIACFVFNISSPGTRIRQSTLNGMDIIDTIKYAILGGVKNISLWIGLNPIFIVIVVLPIYLKLIKIIRDNKKFEFRMPLLVVIFSLGWICAMYCPPLYAMSNMGAGRLNNVVYYNFVILFFIDTFYCMGWVVSKLEIKQNYHIPFVNIKLFWCVGVLMMGLLVARSRNAWGVEAIKELKDGIPQSYSKQSYERNELLLNSAEQNVILKKYIVYPWILYFDDIANDASDWRNKDLARYYNLKSVIIEE